MALEDAVVLARAIAEAADPADAFTRYHRLRARRTARTVRLSRLWGRAGLVRQPALVRLRDGVFRRIPATWLEREALRQYGYDPGTLAG
jgi:2-polyprenyl-6-methoxyphenol hydroxylase-like FAD-dependent oxidoreductase